MCSVFSNWLQTVWLASATLLSGSMDHLQQDLTLAREAWTLLGALVCVSALQS